MSPKPTKNLLLGIFLLVRLCAVARDTDSLKAQLRQTSKVAIKNQLFYEIGREYYAKNKFDSAFHYLGLSLQLSKQTGNDTLAMRSLGIFASVYSKMGDWDNSRLYFDSALQYARKLNRPETEIELMTKIGNTYGMQERYYLAADEFKEVLTVATSVHDKNAEARTYRSLGVAYMTMEDYATGIDYMQRGIKVTDSLKNFSLLVTYYVEMEIMYAKQKKYDQALRYGNMADSLYGVLKDTINQNNNILNLGYIYKEMGDYQREVRLYKNYLNNLARHLQHDDIDEYERAIAYNNLGTALSAMGKFDEAEKNFLTAVEINSKLHNQALEIKNYTEMAAANLLAKHLDSALYYAKLAEKVPQEFVPPGSYKDCIYMLSDIYVARGDYANAHLYDRKYEALQDSIFYNKQSKNLAEAEIRFKLAENNKELAVARVKTQRQAVINSALIVGLGLVLLIVAIVVVVYRRTLRKNALLGQQRQIIDGQIKQLDAAASMKSRFLANISHELRTPVTLLSGMLELMKDKKNTDPTDREKMNVAYNNSRKLQQMIEEILDLSKLENKATQLKTETKEVSPLLKRMTYAFETLFEKEGITLEYEDMGTKDVFISIDLDKFEKIINNLVYNAIKFNHKGGKVKVTLQQDADKKEVTIDIADSGSGIAPADLPHVFERFYQGNTFGVKAAGAGIGLSLVKEFTAMLNGTVGVTSELGKGTTFSLHFPVADKPAADATEDDLTQAPGESWGGLPTRPTVLLVEDNDEMRYYLKEVLGNKAITAEAGNGAEALRWLENNQPDLVISDMMMPEMDGKEFVAALKKTDRYKNIPVITLTALADPESQISMLRMGVDDYIVKPFNATELRIRAYNLLANHAERKQYSRLPPEPGDIPAESKEAEEFRGKITAYVLLRLKNDISVTDLASELALSERQLYRLAKTLTGCSPAQLVKEVRLQKAYELLVGGQITKIEEVARKVGYDKASYFSQQFYERFGKRATEFL